MTDPERLAVDVDHASRKVYVRNRPAKTRILFTELAKYPTFLTYTPTDLKSGVIAVNAANVCLTYAAVRNLAWGGYDCELLLAAGDPELLLD